MLWVLGWDVVGVVQFVGEEVMLFVFGDEVWYVGVLGWVGSNSEYQLVDECLVVYKLCIFDNVFVVVLLLMVIIVWELLFYCFGVEEGGNVGDMLLIVGVVGGVGFILIQLVSKLIVMMVIGIVLCFESQQWVCEVGVYYVIDYSKLFVDELVCIGIMLVIYVVSLINIEQYFNVLIDVFVLQGKLVLIDDLEILDVVLLKVKSLFLYWEFMFICLMFEMDDMIVQYQLFICVVVLIDNYIIKIIFGEYYGVIIVVNLQKVYCQLEIGCVVGKIVLEGF